MNDAQWAAEYSGLPDGDRRLLAALREHDPSDDDAEVDDMDRFQDAEGFPYRLTIDFDAATFLEARLYADLIRATVRRHDMRIACPACKGTRWITTGSPINPRSMRRCTACTDGTVVENPAVVTFEASGEVGSEALVPVYFSPSERADQERRLAESVRIHPSNAGRT